ncbi:MAG: ABC-2 transporter permease [Oscillospiraceae bacterium]|nr:ABC-2 transporter permease [Oscillospiraceae bacterium]
MIGLLRKDLFVADKSGRLLLVLALVFSVVPGMGSFGSTYAVMLALMMPMTSIAYDERSKWDKYAAMLPYTPGQIVWSKYLLSYFYTVLGGGIIVLGTFLRGITTGSADWRETMEMTVLMGVIMLFIMAIGLPVIYRFGSEKGRLAMFVIMGVGVGAALGIVNAFKKLPELPKLPSLPLPVIAAVIAVLVAAATYASFRLSVRLYKKRQNGAYD